MTGKSLYYLDSTARSDKNALGYWLSQEVPAEQAHLRIKSGYFTINGLGALKASIDHLVQNDLPISMALGANEKATIKADVDTLYTLLGCPRPNAKICVISCAGGLFHPKVVHLTRTDGSELAYVGSANVTPAGINGANVEAGILLDSRKGDPIGILKEISASVDDWFKGAVTGVTHIAGHATTQQLVDDGILGVVSQFANNGAGSSSSGSTTAKKIALKPLVSFPSLVAKGSGSSVSGGTGKGSVKAATGATPGIGGLEVLVAEIGKGVRWKQANFPIAIMKGYFGVNPTASEHINLYPVAANGTQSPPVDTQVVNVQSQNYRIELTSVSGVAYPSSGRPIGVFRKIGHKKFRYRVFFPGDAGYSAQNSWLTSSYTGPTHQLKRMIISSSDLNTIWMACPV